MKRSIYLAGIIALATSGIIPAFAQDSEPAVTGQVETNQQIEEVADNDDISAPDMDADELAFAPGGGAAACPSGKHMSFTDDQLEKINTLKNQLADAIGPKKLELHSLHRQMRDLMTQPNVDRGKVTSLENKINSLRSQISDLSLGFRLDSLAILTDEQKQQMRHRFLQRSVMGGGRFGHHKHGFGGPSSHHHHFKGGEGAGPAGPEKAS